jgi:hypothetical protein
LRQVELICLRWRRMIPAVQVRAWRDNGSAAGQESVEAWRARRLAGGRAYGAARPGRYRVVRPFLVLLAKALPLAAAPARQKILTVARCLPGLAARRVRQRPLARAGIDAAMVPPVRGRVVYGNRDLPAGAVDRDPCVLCVLEQLRAALRRRDVFAAPSLRWAAPRALLLDGPGMGRRSGRRSPPRLGLAGPAGEEPAGPGPLADAAWRCLGTWRRLRPAAGEPPVGLLHAQRASPRRSAEFADARPLVFRL